MKKNYYIYALALASGMLASCSNDMAGTGDLVPNTEVAQTLNTRAFAEDDGAKELSGLPADKVNALLDGADSAFATTYANYDLMSLQLQEIKEFTDNLLAQEENPTEARKYRVIYNWVRQNVKYADGEISNEPYDVFINKKAVCQGYANLLNVMLRTQGIWVANSNGYMNNNGSFFGHAWNYVKYGGKWRLSDPTNSIEYTASETSQYNQKFYPMSLDGNLIENEVMAVNYVNEGLNLNVVKQADDAFVVPFSVTMNDGKKYQISYFSPTQQMPDNVTEVYIGKNIKELGRDNTIGLRNYGPKIEAAHVDPANQFLESVNGIVYQKENYEPLYIPTGMESITLRPCEVIGKNFVYNHPNVEELIIPEGTKKLENWAVENCPNLKVAFVPADTEIDENAFVGVHASFEIVRQDATGISNVLAD